jgi:thioesterase domain-containing protein/aryl carrier-like protein
VAYEAPRTEREAGIAEVWQEVLGVERVGVNDDFFELGGHSLLIMRVAARTQDRGIALTFRELAERRTVAGLAAALEERLRQEHPSRALVWLRSSGRRRPLFCVHPGGGSSQWYRHLAERMEPDRPVAAFEAPTLDTGAEPLARTEDLAALYLGEMRAAQPHGPYNLMAWCGGSAIAFEMARLLRETGERVDPLVLVDPTVDVHEQATAAEMLRAFERCELLFEAWLRPWAGDDRSALLAELLTLLAAIVDDDMATPPAEEDLTGHLLRRLRVWRLLHQARMTYRFAPNPQRVLLVVGDDVAREDHVSISGRSYARYCERWRELAAGGLEVARLPGSHLGIMRPPHVAELARFLSERLEEVTL